MRWVLLGAAGLAALGAIVLYSQREYLLAIGSTVDV